MFNFSLKAVPLLTLLSLTATDALATTVLHVPLAQMAKESEVILHARVVAAQTVQEAGSDRILTLTAVEVLTAVKGVEEKAELTIYQVGGTLEGRTLRVIGALTFAPGEEFVLFGVRYADMIVSYGMGLGKYAVSKKDGKAWVAPEFGDVQRVKPSPSGGYQPVNVKPSTAEPLEAFLARVRELALVAGGAK